MKNMAVAEYRCGGWFDFEGYKGPLGSGQISRYTLRRHMIQPVMGRPVTAQHVNLKGQSTESVNEFVVLYSRVIINC